MPAEINLLRSKTRYSPEVALLVGQLRRISYFVVFGVLITGVAVASIYFYLQLSLTSLLNRKSQLISEVKANARKETLYRDLKAELKVAAQALSVQKKWDSTVKTILSLAGPTSISSLSVDDAGQLAMNAKTDTIEEAGGLVGSIVSLIGQNKIKDPVLQNFEVDKAGGVRMLISFTPILP